MLIEGLKKWWKDRSNKKRYNKYKSKRYSRKQVIDNVYKKEADLHKKILGGFEKYSDNSSRFYNSLKKYKNDKELIKDLKKR